MSKVVLLVYLLVSIVSLVTGQPACGDLDISSNGEAISGNDLPVCATSELQCCTVDYINERRDELRETMIAYLKMQLDGNGLSLTNVTETIENYLRNKFVQAFLRLVPGRDVVGEATHDAIINTYITELADNIEINTTVILSQQFNTTDYFARLISGITASLAQYVAITYYNNEGQECIGGVLEGHIDRDNVRLMVVRIQRIRQALTALIAISNWYIDTFQSNLAGYMPSDECIDNFVALTCAECSQNIPQLCTRVCSAIVLGCYAPFQDGLRAQLNNLWNVTRQLVNLYQPDVTALAGLMRNIFDVTVDTNGLFALVNEITTTCGISPNIGRKRSLERVARQDEDEEFVVPASVSVTIALLTGTFTYGASGPAVCSSDSINSTQTDCWNGTQQVSTSTITFTDGTINGQSSNPVYSFDTDNLAQQANALGVPVNSFLEEAAIAQILPSDVVVPTGMPYADEEPETTSTPTSTSTTTPIPMPISITTPIPMPISITTPIPTPTSIATPTPTPLGDSAGTAACALSALVIIFAIITMVLI